MNHGAPKLVKQGAERKRPAADQAPGATSSRCRSIADRV